MQFTLAALALAATALASSHHNHFGMHRRQLNVSSSAIEPIVTPTPIATLAPITSIFSTVIPIGTGIESVAPIPEPSVAPGPGEEVVTETVDSTLTYTLGTGPSATVVTTTVQHVSTRTITHTVFVTRPTAAATDAVEEAAEPTTTVRQTSTFTKVITVFPANTGAAGSGGNAANPTGTACEAASTVYLTEKETIYVTVARSSPFAAAPTVVAPILPESSSAHVEQPIHSSQAGYYPTGAPGQSGVASSSGFLTSYQAQPTGYTRRSFAHRA